MDERDAAPNVGQRLRALREARGLSLRALAARCDLSVNAISRIERGEHSPTVTSLHLLAQALGVPIAAFFQSEQQSTTVLVRGGNRMAADRGGMRIESLGSGLRNQQLEPFLVTLAPGAGADSSPVTHAGQEFVYCLTGEVMYRVADEAYRLRMGDSLLFEASQPHCLANESEAAALVLLVFQSSAGHNDARQRHLEP